MARHQLIRIYCGKVCLDNAVGKWSQPPLRFPLVSVFAPDIRISVGSEDGDYYVRVFRHNDLANRSTISANDWLEKGKNDVLASTE